MFKLFLPLVSILFALASQGNLLAQKSIPIKHSKAKTSNAKQSPAFKDSFSYALGVNYAKYILSQEITVRPQDVAKGMSDIFNKRKLLLDSSQIQAIIDRMARESIAKIVAHQKADFKAFLANNKRNPKVKELAPGLQYEVLKDTTGVKPTDTSRVTVNYTGRLLNGTIFDQTTNGEPISFGLNQVIRGWRETLIHMPKGAIWRVYIDSDHAYGDRGAGNIPGGAGLIFDIQLVDIQP